MSDSPTRLFVALRALGVASGFVLLWTWLATAVRRYDARLGLEIPDGWRAVGWPLAVLGALLAGACVVAFVLRGEGTPAPFDPPRRFVASGPYRFVRNPMYLGGAAVIAGAGLVVGSVAILLLAAAFLAFFHLFVVLYEEPALTRRFGSSYLEYRRSVNRWLPRRPPPTSSRWRSTSSSP